MGLLPPELTFNIKPTFLSRNIKGLLHEVSTINNFEEKMSRLKCSFDGLDHEMNKIDAYTRELSVCMLLLKDAMLFLKEEAAKGSQILPLMEVFELQKDSREASTNSTKSKVSEMGFLSTPVERSRDKSPGPGLSLSPPGSQESRSLSVSDKGFFPVIQPSCRKQRRCWSPELHRKFVYALQQLGGCQVATPKQIRDLMRVEGLTNDEVKSHLQKYRLHSSRARSSALGSGKNSGGFVSLWMNQGRSVQGSSVRSPCSGSQESVLLYGEYGKSDYYLKGLIRR